ncbi:MAG: response regulator [Lachnospiraceae bacterium]|nr:response regulator [Lachnospiraceae bacterium]
MKKTEQSVQTSEAYTETFRAPDARILVVDDTEMNLVVMEGLLKQTALQIDTATGGRQALHLTEDTPYDLILMDQRMPEMDGIQTLQGIRAQEGGSNQNTPVICLTADAVQGARGRYLAEGFTDYLTKPVEILSLEAALMKYLPQEKVERIKKNSAEINQGPQAQPVANSKTPASADSGKEMSREEALHFMREETPKLLASLETLLGDLNPYFQKEEKADADAPEISREELDELYEAITEFAAVYDQESILGLLRQTDAYRIPDADRKKLEQIRKYVSNSDWNGLQYCH